MKKKFAGRKKGALNKATREVKAISQSLLLRPKYQKQLQQALDARTLHPSVESMLWYYAYGKPKEIIETTQPVPVRIVHQFSDGADNDAETTARPKT